MMFPVSFHFSCVVKLVDGQLKSEGIRVSRQRIRECLKRIDPHGVEHRTRHALHRRSILYLLQIVFGTLMATTK